MAEQEEEADEFNFNFSPELTPSQRVEENYIRSLNLIEYLKHLSKDKKISKGDLEGEEVGTNQSSELETVWQYLDNFYDFGDDGKIEGGKNPLNIRFDEERFEPINVETLPNLEEEGGVVLIEFFTHCCINCIHSIEDVRAVYQAVKKEGWGGGLSVVSIHSPKFKTERDHESILAFVEQVKMDYTCVVNDPDNVLWKELGISCWPTLLVLGPGRNLLLTFMGEGHKSVLKVLLSSMLEYFHHKLKKDGDSIDGKTKNTSVKKVVRPQIVGTEGKLALRYPGKVAYFEGLLAISDTGHHRIVVADVNGAVKWIVGGTNSGGYQDGTFTKARFYLPQGLAFLNRNTLFVADTGNHVLRKVDLPNGQVSTLIAPNWSSILDGETVYLRSPWDLTFYSEQILLVAAAGNHRIFAYFFETSKLFEKEFPEGTLAVIAGTGKEENRNNAYILKASFAQPSGICILNSINRPKLVYIADSESSSIRCITTDGKGKVTGVVGGARDPTDLFAYGDVDGKGVNAKLQHPLGVCADDKGSRIYLVDTYNHKVKAIDVDASSCCTVSGSDGAGDVLGDVSSAKYNEPGGISINQMGGVIYVADTNNHAVKSIHLASREVSKITLVDNNLTSPNDFVSSVFHIGKDTTKSLIKITKVPDHFEGGQWNIWPSHNRSGAPITGTIIRNSAGEAELTLTHPADCDDQDLLLHADIFLCGTSTCYKRSLKFLIKRTSETIVPTQFVFNPEDSFFMENI